MTISLLLGICLFVLQLGDVASTRIGLRQGRVELNIIARRLLHNYSFDVLALLKLCLACIIIVVFVLVDAVLPLVVLFGLYCFINGWNWSKLHEHC